jgi:hypothetical protein
MVKDKCMYIYNNFEYNINAILLSYLIINNLHVEVIFYNFLQYSSVLFYMEQVQL